MANYEDDWGISSNSRPDDVQPWFKNAILKNEKEYLMNSKDSAINQQNKV